MELTKEQKQQIQEARERTIAMFNLGFKASAIKAALRIQYAEAVVQEVMG